MASRSIPALILTIRFREFLNEASFPLPTSSFFPAPLYPPSICDSFSRRGEGEREFDIKTREDERILSPREEASEAQKKRTRWRYIYTSCEITSAARKLPALFTRSGADDVKNTRLLIFTF